MLALRFDLTKLFSSVKMNLNDIEHDPIISDLNTIHEVNMFSHKHVTKAFSSIKCVQVSAKRMKNGF